MGTSRGCVPTYERFAAMLSAHAKRDELVTARVPGGASLYLGWATGDRAYLVL
jgi:hypothetical protein